MTRKKMQEPNVKAREVFLSDPVLTTEEADALREVIRSGWITMGDRVFEFERRFADAHGAQDAIAVASCTAALHLILIAMGVESGDEVLVPSLTFAATANSVCYAGAAPVFVDIQSLSRPHLDMADAEAKITPRTKAVIVMHYGGWACEMNEWQSFADKHGLILVEDAAHAPGHSQVAKHSGATAFSFYGNKNMTTAEGGMIIAESGEIAERLRRLRSHGMTTLTLDRRAGHAYTYDVTDLGYNYRMDEVRAAIGLVQLRKLGQWNEKRNALLTRYRETVEASELDVILPFSPDEETTGHLCPLVLGETNDKYKVMRELRSRGVHSSNHYPPVHDFSYYKRTIGRKSLPLTEQFSAREISLPIHPAMDVGDVDYVVETLAEVL